MGGEIHSVELQADVSAAARGGSCLGPLAAGEHLHTSKVSLSGWLHAQIWFSSAASPDSVQVRSKLVLSSSQPWQGTIEASTRHDDVGNQQKQSDVFLCI
jgi:hypothetical protein